MRTAISGRVVEIAYGDVALSTIEFIQTARRMGYDGVELRLTQLKPDMPDDEIDAIAAALRDSGAAFTRYMTAKVGDEAQWAQFARAVGLARRLGAESVGIWVVDASWTQRCCDLLADNNLPLVLQTHSGPHIGTPEDCRRFLEDVHRDNLRLMYDPSHFYLNDRPYGGRVFAALKDAVAGLGLQKFEKVEEAGKVKTRRLAWDAPHGVDLAGAVKGARAAGFDGLVTVIEPYDDAHSPEAQMRTHFEQLQRLLLG